MHGYANVTVKGHADRRRRDWQKLSRRSGKPTGKANVAGWQQLAAKFSEMGAPVQQGGERLVN
jgi:hypothetical protein